MPDEQCRLCGGRATPLFRVQYLYHLDVQIFQCRNCESLQTERPYWLEVSYAPQLLGFGLDTALRCRDLEAWIAYVTIVFGRSPRRTRVLDYGSGPGLLVRMLRDLGFDAYGWDPYASPLLASGFEGDPEKRHDMLTAIETWEHFSEPERDIERQFAPGHDLILIRTRPYRGEGPGWYYFFPEGGQHVFFYSHKARELIARKFGYDVCNVRDLTVFSRRKISVVERALLTNPKPGMALARAALAFMPRPGFEHDLQFAAGPFQKMLCSSPWADRILAMSKERASNRR